MKILPSLPSFASNITPAVHLALLLTALAAAAPADAAVIAQYSFTGNADLATSSPATSQDPNVTAGSFIKGAGLANSFAGVSGSFGNPSPGWFVRENQTDQAVSASSTDYIGFTVTPNVNNALNLTNLTFNYAYVSTTAGDPLTNVGSWTYRSSLDSFASDISGGVFSSTVQLQSSFTWLNGTVDLSGAQFQNLTTPIEFRIYVTDNGNTTTRTLRNDNFILNGAVVSVPEPSTKALLGLATVLLSIVVRRSGRSNL